MAGHASWVEYPKLTTVFKTLMHMPPFRNKSWWLRIVGLAGSLTALACSLQTAAAQTPSSRPVFLLEAVDVKGSERLPEGFLADELGLSPGQRINEEDLDIARTRLLGSGLFQSAQFFLSKGQAQDRVRLVIELEDDSGVLGPWAWGSSIAVLQEQNTDTSLRNPNQIDPYGIKAQIVSRNLLRHLHRAAVQIDMDGKGILRGAQFAYGFPRFSAEDAQFDASMEGTDGVWRYFEVLGFGTKGHLTWTLDRLTAGSFEYGVALFSNQEKHMRLPGFPDAIVGPRVGLRKETRLLSFRTSSGYSYTMAALLTTEGLRHMAFELGGAYSTEPWSQASLTLQSENLSVGGLSLSSRHSLRLEQALPVWHMASDPLLYLQGLWGHDTYREVNYAGTEWKVGLRFHSAGFIADLGLTYSLIPHLLKEMRNGEVQP